MDDLLFLTHSIPYPPNKGDKIRSFHLLQYLSGRYRVHLATFVDEPADWGHCDAVRSLCESAHFASLRPGWAKWRSLSGFLTGDPLSLPYYRNRDLARWISQTKQRHGVKRILVFSSAMAQYVLGSEFADARRVVDFVDVDSDKWRQYAESKKFPMSWLFRREARRLADFERLVASTCDASVFVSSDEAEFFRTMLVGERVSVTAVSNGVDSGYFSPVGERESPFEAEGPTVVFTGAMDYWANEEGASWFAQSVLPKVQEAFPGTTFYIVGMNPTEGVRQLARLPGVVVTGGVPDVRPYLQHARAVAVPLRIARGIQNKVLEAMSMAKAVVTTPEALEGIPARAGREVMVAGDAETFAQGLIDALAGDGGEIGNRARAFIEREFSWERNLPRIGALLEGE